MKEPSLTVGTTQGESVEQYITILYSLIKNCEYGNLASEMLRDRLVVGIQDTALSEHLQMNAGLTLEKAKLLICQHEAVQEHQVILNQTDKQSTVDHIHRKTSCRSSTATRHPPTQTKDAQSQQAKCKRCGINHMRLVNVQQKRLCVISAREKVITVANVSPKLYKKSLNSWQKTQKCLFLVPLGL